MKYAVSVLVVLLLSTSCATMFNRSHTHVDILSDRPGFRVVYGDDTVATETRNIELVVPRSREPLELHYDVGRGFADTLIRARMSGTAWLNFENAFLGLIIDKKRDKGYTYRKVRLYKTYRKGYLSLSPMIMFGNLFQQESHAWGRVNNGGFWGIGLGMDYYYTDSKFVMMNYGVAINFPLPFPAPMGILWGQIRAYGAVGRRYHMMIRFQVRHMRGLDQLWQPKGNASPRRRRQ